MSWNQQQQKVDARRAKFLALFPDFPPISQAPDSVSRDPAYMALTNGHERDEYEDAFWAKEGLKSYKAIDAAGNIFRMRNPAIARRKPINGVVRHEARERLGHIDDFSGGGRLETSKSDIFG